uniref:ubiquitinyl hydrolase 1 n=1 Tax=Eptatretus burgeri TaxID=7764 RepID=A0A8C4R1T8_EPTBU
MAEGGVPAVETQRVDMSMLLRTNLKKGDTWYLIDSWWFKQWKKFVGFDTWDLQHVGDQSPPGCIDNSGLLRDSESQVLRDRLIDELDYVLVPTDAWNKLVSWYGFVEGQNPIARKVVEYGMFVKHCKVEVYLTELILCKDAEVENSLVRHFSKADTIGTIENEMKKLFKIADDQETRLWNKYSANNYEALNKPESTIQDAGLCQGQILVIEQKAADGSWPRHFTNNHKSVASAAANFSASPCISTSPCSSSTSSPALSITPSNYSTGYPRSSYNTYGCNTYEYREPGRGSGCPGLCGLCNLGNTCFMNSAIQCLSNTPPLTEYFTRNAHLEELNTQNPLGMRGEMAKVYAELIQQMWSGCFNYVTPRAFKTLVGKFAPQFSGYQQQDSQELLAFLLDGLHEDLNRIVKKPYVELKDADGRPDELVACEAWENHQKRNNSIIVDIFHGLFKSTLVCPDCAKVSVTFDPFCYLTLPLPMRKERCLDVILIPADPRCKPTQYKTIVPKSGQISDLCVTLSKLSGISAHKMVVTDVYNHRFHKIFPMDEKISSIYDRDDIFVYEVQMKHQDDCEHILVPVYLREKRLSGSGFNSNLLPGGTLFGQPLLLSVPRHTTTCQKLYQILLERMDRYVNRPADEDDDDSYDGLFYMDQNNVNNMHFNRQNGEVDMEDEESSHDHEIPSETDDSPLDESDKEVELAGREPMGNVNAARRDACRARRRPPLFTFHIVNAYGSSEINTIMDDGQPIKFTNRPYIALDWDSRMKQYYYDEKAAEDLKKHESMSTHPARKHMVRLHDCIKLFTTREMLGEHDLWYCPSCKKHKQATKQLDLWSLPEVLVVHLKRFFYNRYLREKLDTLVDFPIRSLDMSGFVINPNAGQSTYDLIAAVNHYGGMGGGHYTVIAKHKDDGQWYYFDDSSVSPASEEQVVTKAAYVLFYQRQGTQTGTYKATGRKATASASISSPTAAAMGHESELEDGEGGGVGEDENEGFDNGTFSSGDDTMDMN